MPLPHPGVTLGSNDVDVIQPSDVQGLVSRIIAWRKEGETQASLFPGGAKVTLANRFDSLADLGRYDWRAETSIGGVSDVGLESMIGNSAGLMATRQNTFIVIVAAKPFSVGMGTASTTQSLGTWMGMKRAIIQLRRDPYPTQVAPGVWKCRTQVYNFKWLNED